MSKQMIPNIFVKQVDLFNSSEQQMGIKITTIIDDMNGWSNTRTTDHIKTLVVISSDPTVNFEIENSDEIFDKDTLMRIYGENKQVKIFSRQAKTRNMVNVADGKRYLDTFEVEFNKSEEQIKVYCGCFFEMKEILQNLNLDSTGQLRRYGPMYSDTIKENGDVKTITTAFIRPNGNQYVGPVHFHPEKGYMEGATHSDKPHDVLTTTEVFNFKIKDYTKKNYKTPDNVVLLKNSSSFSKLGYSISSQGSTSGIFSIDFKKILINETKYGKFLKSLSDEAVQLNLNNLIIKSFTITRKRIDVDETYIVITTTGREGGGGLTYTDAVLPNENISLISSTSYNQNNVQTIYFSDGDLNRNKLGLYEYHVDFSFVDPTVPFIQDMIAGLNESKLELDRYYNILNKQKNYDYELDNSRQRFYESQFADSSPQVESPSWSKANQRYVEAMSYLYELTAKEKRLLTFSIATKIDPRNATLFSLASFIADFDNLINIMNRKFDLSKTDNTIVHKKTFVKTPNSRNVIFIKNKFKEQIRSKNYTLSYNYLNVFDNYNIFLRLKKTDFLNRMRQEYNKFFKSSPNPEEYINIPDEYKSVYDLDTMGLTFLSPMSITLKDERIVLRDIEDINSIKINNLFNPKFEDSIPNIVSTQTPDSQTSETTSVPYQDQNVVGLDGNGQLQTDLSGPSDDYAGTPSDSVSNTTEENDFAIEATEEELGEFLESRRYLGDNSLFVNYESILDEGLQSNVSLTVDEDISELFNIPSDINSQPMGFFTLSYIAQIYSQAYVGVRNIELGETNTETVSSLIKRLPNQLKALLTYRNSHTKKFVGTLTQDMMTNLLTQAPVNVNYFKLVCVEVLDGYEPFGLNQDKISNPKYRKLTQDDLNNLTTPIFCRLRPYYNKEFGIKRDRLSFPIENEHFIIEPDNIASTGATNSFTQSDLIVREQRNISVQHSISRNIDPVGTTSNITTTSTIANPDETMEGPTGTGFNEAVGNINRLSVNASTTPTTTGGGSTGGGY